MVERFTAAWHWLRPRLWWRAERILVRVFGRRIVCAACGRPLFVGIPIVWRGKLLMIGLRINDPLVSVRFERKDTLEFRHGELDACPTEERPWVRPVADVWHS
jgi:hypothetical protein